ncbi:S-adenosyl-L-methionine-dependent methyltransferase [Schizophyllum commune]
MATSALEANTEYYDDEAVNFYKNPAFKRDLMLLTKFNAFAIIRAATLDPNTTEVLDYACGAGVVSFEVSPLCKSIVGADISKGMLGEFEKLKAPNMTSKVIDGTIPPETQFDGQKFDVIFCCAAYHHFDSPKDMTISLGKLLKEGGQLIVTDFASGGHESLMHQHGQPEGEQPSHGHHHHKHQQHAKSELPMSDEVLEKAKTTIVHKHGFASSELEEWMELAGLQRFTFDTFPRVHAINTDSVAFAASAFMV